MLRLLVFVALFAPAALAAPERPEWRSDAYAESNAEAEARDGRLSPAYPNPFAERTRLVLHVTTAQAVRVELFDVLGRRVRTLFAGRVAPDAPVSLDLAADDLPNGLYVVRATAPTFRATRRVMLAR